MYSIQRRRRRRVIRGRRRTDRCTCICIEKRTKKNELYEVVYLGAKQATRNRVSRSRGIGMKLASWEAKP
jgi:hypothetical protein